VALAFLGVAVLAVWLGVSLFQPFAGSKGARVAVTIPRGATPGQIASLLEQRGVVDSATFFRWRVRLAGKSGELKSGSYALAKGMTYAAAMDALTAGPPPPKVRRVTIPEGRSRVETAPLVRAAGVRGDYLTASARSDALDPRRYGAPAATRTLEGFLFPATYELRLDATARTLVAQQLKAFRASLATVDLRRARAKNLTPYDVVIIASMVEREAQLARERPLIAAVIYNRLKQGIRLGIDATIRYETRNWTKPLVLSVLQRDTPYNTRTRAGLPPTPIGNPGLASLQAAANPARVPYLYYVVKPGTCGQHAFSATDAQFARDVARYNAARERLGGKSPTTCPK